MRFPRTSVPGSRGCSPQVLQALPGERVAPCAPGRLVRIFLGPGPASWVLLWSLLHIPFDLVPREKERQPEKGLGVGMKVDVGEEQTRGMATLESLRRIWVATGFPLGKNEALVGDGKRKVERLLAGEAQVSVPDALPTLARDRRHASVGHRLGRGCCNPLGSGSPVLLPPCAHCCAEPVSLFTNRSTFSSSWTVGTHLVQQLEKLSRKCGYDVCSLHRYLSELQLR